METKELLKKVRQIEIKTRGLSNHIFAGEYHSAFKGRGMSFNDFREYQPGDDVRTIDWNVTARFDSPYVKVYEEERELTLFLMVDISESGLFSTNQASKRQIITEICAVLAFSALTNNDKVGILLFSDQIEKFIPPKKGKSHILHIISELLNFEPQSKGTNIKVALEYFSNVTKKRTISFILSDFLDSGYKKALQIAARKHDLIGVRLVDPFETNPPKLGLVETIDPESGNSQWLDLNNFKTSESLVAYYEEFSHEFTRNLTESGASGISIKTNESYTNALLKFFKSR